MVRGDDIDVSIPSAASTNRILDDDDVLCKRAATPGEASKERTHQLFGSESGCIHRRCSDREAFFQARPYSREGEPMAQR